MKITITALSLIALTACAGVPVNHTAQDHPRAIQFDHDSTEPATRSSSHAADVAPVKVTPRPVARKVAPAASARKRKGATVTIFEPIPKPRKGATVTVYAPIPKPRNGATVTVFEAIPKR